MSNPIETLVDCLILGGVLAVLMLSGATAVAGIFFLWSVFF
jgi:hypothetical protein